MNYEICECCGKPKRPKTPVGRWPSNLVHDGSAEVLAEFPMTSSGVLRHGAPVMRVGEHEGWHRKAHDTYTALQDFGGDTGSAARFFYCAKASKQDRDEGCEGLEERDTFRKNTSEYRYEDGEATGQRSENKARNHHPTVKPTALMRYLCRLVTPPQGVILDPFMGSGSTGKAAILEGFNFIGIDTELEYVEIAARRIEHACEKVGIVVDQPMLIESRREVIDRPKQLVLI